MLPAPLEESGTKARLRRGRDRLGAALVIGLCGAGLAACGGGERQDEGEPEGEFPVEIAAAEFPLRQDLAQRSDLLLTVENTGDEALPNLAVTIFTIPSPVTAAEVDAAEADPSGEDEDLDEEALAEQVDQQLQEEVERATEESSDAEGAEATVEDSDEAELNVAKGPFQVLSPQPGLAIRSRPVWILEQGYPRLAGTEPGPGPPGELYQASGALTSNTNTFAFGELEPGGSVDLVWRVTPVQPGTYTVHYRVAAGLQGNAVAVSGDESVPEGEFTVKISAAPPQTKVNAKGKVVPVKPGDTLSEAGGSGEKAELDAELEAQAEDTP